LIVIHKILEKFLTPALSREEASYQSRSVNANGWCYDEYAKRQRHECETVLTQKLGHEDLLGCYLNSLSCMEYSK
jgi:hypothetical protein